MNGQYKFKITANGKEIKLALKISYGEGRGNRLEIRNT